MSYSNKKLIRHTLPLFDFGGGSAEIMSFKVPKDEHGNNQKAKLVDIGVMATEVFETLTTEGSVQVGTAANNDAYGKLNITTATADEACFNVDNDADAILSSSIDAGTLIEVNLTNGTGSGVTGQGIPYIDLYTW